MASNSGLWTDCRPYFHELKQKTPSKYKALPFVIKESHLVDGIPNADLKCQGMFYEDGCIVHACRVIKIPVGVKILGLIETGAARSTSLPQPSVAVSQARVLLASAASAGRPYSDKRRLIGFREIVQFVCRKIIFNAFHVNLWKDSVNVCYPLSHWSLNVWKVQR